VVPVSLKKKRLGDTPVTPRQRTTLFAVILSI